jgi:hypothetical protein
MWAAIGKFLLVEVLLPLIKWGVAAFVAAKEKAAKFKKIKETNKASTEKYEASGADTAGDDFNKLP